MLKFKKVPVPSFLTDLVEPFWMDIRIMPNMYSHVQDSGVQLKDNRSATILWTASTPPHIDPGFPRWTVLWILRNDELLLSDHESVSIITEPGQVIAIDVLRPHSCLPDFHARHQAHPNKIWAALSFESRTQPTQNTVSMMIEQFLSNIILVDGKATLTQASLAYLTPRDH